MLDWGGVWVFNLVRSFTLALTPSMGLWRGVRDCYQLFLNFGCYGGISYARVIVEDKKICERKCESKYIRQALYMKLLQIRLLWHAIFCLNSYSIPLYMPVDATLNEQRIIKKSEFWRPTTQNQNAKMTWRKNAHNLIFFRLYVSVIKIAWGKFRSIISGLLYKNNIYHTLRDRL